MRDRVPVSTMARRAGDVLHLFAVGTTIAGDGRFTVAPLAVRVGSWCNGALPGWVGSGEAEYEPGA
jgi:hypothetical protein